MSCAVNDEDFPTSPEGSPEPLASLTLDIRAWRLDYLRQGAWFGGVCVCVCSIMVSPPSTISPLAHNLHPGPDIAPLPACLAMPDAANTQLSIDFSDFQDKSD